MALPGRQIMKKQMKKLTLARETVLNLDDIGHVVGGNQGGGPTSSYTYPCDCPRTWSRDPAGTCEITAPIACG